MDADRNLLFGVLALQGDLIDAAQFVEACTAWANHKAKPLADLLVERGWINPDDRAHIDYFLARKLRKHEGDAHKSLMEVAGAGVQNILAELNDPEVQRSMAGMSKGEGHVMLSTVGYTPETRERYTLTRLHAKGGLGQVWLARDSNLGREVALKELRPERASDPTVWSRFLEEARITGQLEHPNIVPVHELATPSEGHQPFYTMRFVKGRTLTEAVKAYHQKLHAGQAAPLDLLVLVNAFVGICNAVAYAHSRGVIHRDLKGQNVILGDFGEVVVLDWGLAKQVDRPEETLTPPVSVKHEGDWSGTIAGQALGTPVYMAPEQAEGRLEQIDQRTDVYGLGAVLYEVIAGQPPFAGDSTQEVLRRVCQEEPARPRQHNPQAPAALEAVCLKALAKRPEGRYSTASELARDVQRWLADEPVSAYPEPMSKRAGRWARRHKPLVASAAVLLATSVVALSVSTVLINRERARAEESFRQARRAVDDYFTTVSESKLFEKPGLQPLRKELLDSALKYYQGFLRQRGRDPSVRAELAATYYRVAWITQQTGSIVVALKNYDQAVSLYEQLIREQPAETKYQSDLAICFNDRGNLLRAFRRNAEALQTHRKALAIRERLAKANPQVVRLQNEVAKSYANIGTTLRDVGKFPEALEWIEKARDVNERLVQDPRAITAFSSDLGKPYNTIPVIQGDLAVDFYNIGYIQASTNRPAEAMASYQRAREILEKLIADDPDNFPVQSRLAQTYQIIGFEMKVAGRDAEAIQIKQKARELVEKLVAGNPGVPSLRSQLAQVDLDLGLQQRNQQQPREALNSFRRATAILEKLRADEPAVKYYQERLAAVYRYIGTLPSTVILPGESLSLLRQSEVILKDLPDPAPVEVYNLACTQALLIPLIGQGRPSAEQQAERERYQALALESLRKAISRGYKNVGNIKTDDDLVALHSLTDYREIVR
ncbi:MAG TPA: serine/threonine-protein kinase [Isosphaeraceae bacterium]|nr:serine/threonine-protein kinase [Isosphaeraceae bacterium]